VIFSSSQGGEFVFDGLSHALAERLRLKGGVGAFVHNVFNESVGGEGCDVDTLGLGHGRSEVRAPVDYGAGAFGR
jgi:hypothetical protein